MNMKKKSVTKSRIRISEQLGFVLHRYPYRETSLIVDVFTRDYGRMALIAKGAKRPHSALRHVLQMFQPLVLSWSGLSEMRSLTHAQWHGGVLPISGDALVYGFYLNELLLLFCAREDPHPILFDHYINTLIRLTQNQLPLETHLLRSFERALLRETGHATGFDTLTKSRARVIANNDYVFDPELGPRLVNENEPNDWPKEWPKIVGQTLIDIEQDQFTHPKTAIESKILMRFLLNHYSNGAIVKTRKLLIDLHKL